METFEKDSIPHRRLKRIALIMFRHLPMQIVMDIFRQAEYDERMGLICEQSLTGAPRKEDLNYMIDSVADELASLLLNNPETVSEHLKKLRLEHKSRRPKMAVEQEVKK